MQNSKHFVDKAMELQHKIESRGERIGRGKYGRVLTMARKPDSEEYNKTSKITLAGILLIGAVGFAIYLIIAVIVPWVMTQLGT